MDRSPAKRGGTEDGREVKRHAMEAAMSRSGNEDDREVKRRAMEAAMSGGAIPVVARSSALQVNRRMEAEKLAAALRAKVIKSSAPDPSHVDVSIDTRRQGIKKHFRFYTAADRETVSLNYALVNPEIEPWDIIFLQSEITSLVYHPVPLDARGVKEVSTLELPLTHRERVKLRRMRRQEARTLLHDKIRVGAIPPPPSKVRLGNMHKLTASGDAPTAFESMVRDQMEQRQKGHEERNAANQLSPVERRVKKEQYWSQKDEVRTTVQLYSLPTGNRDLLRIIDLNAKQLHLTGAMFSVADAPEGGPKGLAVFEGGQRGTRRIKRLMVRRLKWAGKNLGSVVADQDDSDDWDKGDADVYNDRVMELAADTSGASNRAVLKWEGESASNSFGQWRFLQGRKMEEVKHYLMNRDMGHLISMVWAEY